MPPCSPGKPEGGGVYIYDRREDMWATTKRHPSRTRVKAGFKRDGTLIALEIDFGPLTAGAYPTLSDTVLSRGILHALGPYRCDDTHLRARCLMTNSVPYGAFRGFGAPQSIFAMELDMSRAAEELGLDPHIFGAGSLLHQGDRMPTGQVIKEEITGNAHGSCAGKGGLSRQARGVRAHQSSGR